MRTIDGDHLKRWIIDRGLKTQLNLADILDQIDRELTIEPERKKGKWIIHPKGICTHLVCNKCLSIAPYDCETNFCPNCGADMRG